ncbi:MAG: hypothetical protein ACE5IR_12275 [bacterium]
MMFKIATLVLTLLFLQTTSLTAQPAEGLSGTIKAIHKDIEGIRGIEFKHPVKVKNQSIDNFGRYLDKMLQKEIPERLAKNYDKVVRKLGLYRGPEIADFRTIAKQVMQSQAAAYYDPETESFYVVMQSLPQQMLKPLYVHELYHGLQDQYYDLENYVQSESALELTDDELLARQAVVEGEATYIMTLWTYKSLLGALPDPFMLGVAINTQAELDVEQMIQLFKGQAGSADTTHGDVQKAIAAMDSIPAFLMETLVGAYLKGMRFVFEIQKKGWEEVGRLYRQPPVSSEQILHPEKWFQNEKPVKLNWPEFERDNLFSDWILLEKNAIGEIQWRIIFSEHNMRDAGKAVAAGWNGDRFAVLEHKKSEMTCSPASAVNTGVCGSPPT